MTAVRRLAAAALAAAPLAGFGDASAAPELDARFASSNGWIGADGIYSAALPGHRTVWLFSDTWTGATCDGARVHPRMINNSVGITEGSGAARFFYPTNAEGQAVSLFTPPDGRGWYWLWAAASGRDTLALFAARVEKTDGGGAFGFRVIGTALGEVENPQDLPTAWRTHWKNLPDAWCPRVFWGSSVLTHEGFAYVYGYTESGKGLDFRRSMLVARVPSDKISDFSAWRFFGNGAWRETPQAAEPVCLGVATEYSVTWHPAYRKFLLVTHDLCLSPSLVARMADQPWGPWSEKRALYACPEASEKRGIFCYAAKLQPVFSDDRTLVISYAANANDLTTVLRDASLYVPRFVRVPASDLFGPQP